MKTIFTISAVAIFLCVAPSPCFALWVTVHVSKERAKELGMEVRSTAAGPNQVRVELDDDGVGTLLEQMCFLTHDVDFGAFDVANQAER